MPAEATNDIARYPRCIMGTCCVPWTTDYQLDESLFRRSIADVLRHVKNLYVFGTAGEGHSVSAKQFQQITRVFVDEMRQGGAEPMVGLINPSLAEVLNRIEWAIGEGVTRFQVSLPSWGACTEAETFTFFEQVCTRFPGVQFMHYNLRRTGRLVSATEYGRLAEAFPNLVAVKMAGATGEEALATQEAAPGLRLFLTEKAFADASLLGVRAGFLISYASLSWSIAKRFFEAGVARDEAVLKQIRSEQDVALAVLRETTAGLAHMDGAFDTMFVKHHLPEFPLRLLPPYAYVNDEAYARFEDGLRQKLPHWMAS